MIIKRTRIGGKKKNNLIIRFQKKNKKFDSNFKIVLIKQKSRPQSFFLDKIGYYNRYSNNRELIINSQKLAYWINHGAKIHNTVKRYICKMLTKK